MRRWFRQKRAGVSETIHLMNRRRFSRENQLCSTMNDMRMMARASTRSRSRALTDAMNQVREDISQDDPRAQALFETAAEVLGGYQGAYAHYERGAEEAWQG